MGKHHLKTAIISLILVLALGGTASAQQPRITADIETQPNATLSAQERMAVSFAAGRILVHVDQARDAIAAGNVEAAKRNLEKAMTLVNIVESTLPTYTVTANIQAGGITYTDRRKVQPLVVELYDDLDKVAVLDPVIAAKREAAKEAGLPPATIELLLQFTQAKLDVAEAKAGLKTAKQALNKGNLQAADQALTLIQTSAVEFSYNATNIPLKEAQSNLLLARNLVQQERYQHARFALMAAADALQRYQSQVGDNRAQQVKALRQEINALQQNIKQNGAQNAESKITQWWNQVVNWFGSTPQG